MFLEDVSDSTIQTMAEQYVSYLLENGFVADPTLVLGAMRRCHLELLRMQNAELELANIVDGLRPSGQGDDARG
jgi:hypothetical protein